MKKKQFTSKLQFQKTIVVSFNSMLNIKGGTLQNGDTRIVSVNGYMCITSVCVRNPMTAIDNTCPPPTTRTGGTNNTNCCIGTTVGGTRLDCTVSNIKC